MKDQSFVAQVNVDKVLSTESSDVLDCVKMTVSSTFIHFQMDLLRFEVVS